MDVHHEFRMLSVGYFVCLDKLMVCSSWSTAELFIMDLEGDTMDVSSGIIWDIDDVKSR